MKLARTLVVLTSVAVAPAAQAAAPANYPDRPIRLILPVPAGGTADVTIRILAPQIANALGYQLVIDNRGGAGGIIGAEMAAKALSDGYTLMMSSSGPLTILPHLQKKMPYAPLTDFTPVTLISSGPFFLITQPNAPYRNIKDFIAMAKAEPGKINYASAGNGSPNHLASELFRSMAGIDLIHVPYKGAPQAVTDVLAGHVAVTYSSLLPIIQHIKSGRARAIGSSGSKRSPQLPDVPTIAESGVPGYEYVSWFGLVAPAGTPREIIRKLNSVFVQAVQSPESRSQFESQGSEAIGNSPEEFGKMIRFEYDRNAKVVKTSGMKID
jgi:tripartite-type tricarboxylate transporter receptor subunit TctC